MKNSNQHTACLTEQELLAYVKREMTPEELRSAEIHITDCELCSDAIEGFQFVQNDRSVAIVSELKKSINKKLEGKVKSLGINLNWIQIAAVLFIIGLSAGSYLYIQRIGNSNIALQNEEKANTSTAVESDTTNYNQQQNTEKSSPSEVLSAEKTVNNVNEDIPKVILRNEPRKDIASEISSKESEALQERENVNEEVKVASDYSDDEIKRDKQTDISAAPSAPAIAEEKFTGVKYEEVTSGAENTETTKEILQSTQSVPSKKKNTTQQRTIYKSSDFEKGKKLYLNEKYKDALTFLEPVSKNKNDSNHDEAIWLCANIKIKQNKKEEARQLLHQLTDSPKYKIDAEKLLNKL